MLRTAGAVVLGYLAMAVTVFAGLTILWLLVGAERAFRPGSFDVSILWVLISLVVGFAAALLGGWVARRVGATATAPRVLAGVVVCLGLVLALPALTGDLPPLGPRTGDTPMFEAMQNARTPVWVLILNPIIGAIGVLVGGRGSARAPAPAPHDPAVRV